MRNHHSRENQAAGTGRGGRKAIQLVLLCLLGCMTGVESARAATYYVACDRGRDTNDGLSELTAWESAAKVSTFPFLNGDIVFFKKGCRWEDVSIKISKSLHFGAYGDGVPPQLMGATRADLWRRLGSQNVFSTLAEIEPSSPVGKEILVVHDKKHDRFYKKVPTIESLDDSGKFYYDLSGRTLYVSPLEGTDLSHDILIGSKPHILEFQQINVERVVIDGLELSFANEYAIGFWYQGSGTKNGSLKIANCLITGNAYQAIHIGGNNTFKDVDILRNTITANGNEGIYIGYIRGKEEGEVVTGMLRISGNVIGGHGFGWRSDGPGSAANGEGIDVKRGIAAAIIDSNTIMDLTGFYGIGVQSSNVVIEKNTISDIHMRDSPPESGIAAIVVDAYESRGPVTVRSNVLNVQSAHGVVIRGSAEWRPRVEIYDNNISVEDPFFPFAFTSQNITNTTIRNNVTKGGRAGLWVQRPCCPPSNVEFHDNKILGVSEPVVAAQSVKAGVQVYANSFCFKSGMDVGQSSALPNNTFSSGCASSTQSNSPQGLRVR